MRIMLVTYVFYVFLFFLLYAFLLLFLDYVYSLSYLTEQLCKIKFDYYNSTESVVGVSNLFILFIKYGFCAYKL
jgi:hypothetical protein